MRKVRCQVDANGMTLVSAGDPAANQHIRNWSHQWMQNRESVSNHLFAFNDSFLESADQRPKSMRSQVKGNNKSSLGKHHERSKCGGVGK